MVTRLAMAAVKAGNTRHTGVWLFFFAGPKGNTISKIEKYCLKICGHARKIKRESGVSRSDLNDERGNGSYGQFHGPDPESWARWKLKLRRRRESGHGCGEPKGGTQTSRETILENGDTC